MIIVRPFLFAFALAQTASAATAPAAAAPDFSREVRPILSRYCFKCHGPDDKARKGKLRLDVREEAMKEAKSGSLALVPGKPDESELCVRIFSTDSDEAMPPAETKNPLSEAQKDTLQRWIAAGAEYKQHWAFVAPKAVAAPGIADWRLPNAGWKNDADGFGDWAKNPVDGFILKSLGAAGLMPSRDADAAAFCRRVYLDLIFVIPAVFSFFSVASPIPWTDMSFPLVTFGFSAATAPVARTARVMIRRSFMSKESGRE